MNIHLVMPMGGAGSRFYKNGYIQPKPLIEICGKPFFYWAVMSIAKYIDVADITFVVLRQHIEQFEIDKVIRSYFPNARIRVLEQILPGPVYTALAGVEELTDEAPVIINDCDHMFCCQSFNDLMLKDSLMFDGVLLTFESNSPQYSYVKYDQNGRIIGTAEKVVVSNHAICGAYIFRNVAIFRDAASEYIQHDISREKFMSGVYTELCEQDFSVVDYVLDFHVEFGTPAEYELAKSSPCFKLFA